MSQKVRDFFCPSRGDASRHLHSYLLFFSTLRNQHVEVIDFDHRTEVVNRLADIIIDNMQSQPEGLWRWVLSTDFTSPLGVRGVSRFTAEETLGEFLLECETVKAVLARLNDPMQLQLVVPFVRTVSEAAKAIDVLAGQGLARGANGLKVHLWCELPNNALLIDKFLPYFDGVLIDEMGLTQSVLLADVAVPELSELFDVPDEGVRQLIVRILNGAEKVHKPCDWVQREEMTLFAPLSENWTIGQIYRITE